MTNGQRQEVVVTDVHMRFTSMVVFMVKWAIASIPAVLILMILVTVLWGTLLGMVASIGSLGRHSETSAPTTGGSSSSASGSTANDSGGMSADEQAYLPRVQVQKVSVGQSYLGEPGAFGEVKNTGDRMLKDVEITIYCLGPDGKPVFEKTYSAVHVSDVGLRNDKPLKPGYSQQFGVRLSDAPSEWNKKVEIKVTKVAFE